MDKIQRLRYLLDNMGKPAEITSQQSPARLEAQLARALEDLDQLRKEKEDLEAQFKEVVTSKSWKITEPLRQFTKLRRSIFPLFRSRRIVVSPKPKRSLSQSGTHFRISGASPCLELGLASEICPQGWVLVDAKIGAPKGTLFFYLYMGRAGAFSETERYLLAFDDGIREAHPIFIPEGISELRLDVYDFDGNFSIENFALQELGSVQFAGAIAKKILFPLMKDPKVFWTKFKRGLLVLREGGVSALRAKVLGGKVTNNYAEWVTRFDSFEESDKLKISKATELLAQQPKISIITPTFNSPERHFRDCLDSVLNQGYPHWELCIADDASTQPHVRRIIEEYRVRDSRIKVIYREKSGHIAEASNSALALATGEYVTFLDHDDELTMDALYMVAREINLSLNAGLIYSDEDKKTGYGMRVNPHFKSDWNPELLLQQNYVCHLTVMKRELVEMAGGFRAGVDGAQDWDLILRVAEKLDPQQIRHIPHILYHWKIIEGSTAQSTSSKPYVLEAQRKSVQEHLNRLAQSAEVSIRASISNLRVRRSLPSPAPLLSIVILTRDKVEMLRRCIESIFSKSTYQSFEILVVDNGSIEDKTFQYFKTLQERGVIIIRDESPFNFSALNNLAAKQAHGDILAFMNNDMEIISPDWMESLIGHAIRPEIGAVGCRLLYPNNLLQHGGVILSIGGVAGHNHKGRPREDPGYFNRAILAQNLSAVTAACVFIRRQVFDQIGGFDESLSVAFNDVDLCLRIRAAGYLIVYEPCAELYHYESASRGYENTAEKFQRFEDEIQRMKVRWKKELRSDPYYNPNLTNLSEDFAFAFPPRISRPWR